MEWFFAGAAGLLFFWSLLAIFYARYFPLFLLAVVATTYGNFMALVAGLVLLACFASSSGAGMILAGAALGIFLTPEIRALLWRHRTGFAKNTWPRVPGTIREQKLEYGDGLRAHCFFIPHETPQPLVVIVHGGGWVSGDPCECPGFLRELVRMGLVVVSVSYRFAPAAPWPAQREDVLRGLLEVLARSEELGIDGQKVWLLGRSAGGQIASSVACVADGIAGCICLYAPFDMVFAYEHGKENDMLRSPQLLRQYLGGPLEEQRENYLSASAFHQVTKDSPPFLLVHGTRDELVWIRQSRRFAEKIQHLGGQVRFLELPWDTHAFDHNAHGPAARITLEAVQKFIFQ